MRIAAVVVLLAALAGTARAEASDEKSPLTAVALSTVPTIGGIVLLTFGLQQQRGVTLLGTGAALTMIGPSLGNVYAGDVWNTGLRIRLISGPLVAGAAVYAVVSERPGEAVALTIGVGTIAYLAGTVLEIGNAHAATVRRNEALAAFVPVVTPEHAGLAVVGSF